jgi:hypothetical protein
MTSTREIYTGKDRPGIMGEPLIAVGIKCFVSFPAKNDLRSRIFGNAGYPPTSFYSRNG